MVAILLAGLLHGQHDGVDANPDLGKALWRQIDPLAAPAGPEARRPCAKLDMRRRFVDLGRGGQDRAQRAPRFCRLPRYSSSADKADQRVIVAITH